MFSIQWKRAGTAFLVLLSPSAAPASNAPHPAAIVKVMVVGDFHMSNPGRDLHNVVADDMLAPKRQREIGSIVDALARFRPTKVGVEWPANLVSARYGQYLAGTLPQSRNEVVQLGFRLARKAGAQGAFGLDVPGDFPYQAVKSFAAENGMAALLDEADALTKKEVDQEARRLASGSVGATLRLLNDPRRLKTANSFYRMLLRIGAGGNQPGADLMSAWTRRNILICARLAQLARPGDRIVVFFGAGHAYLLRQCVSEMPGFRLVEPDRYLPR